MTPAEILAKIEGGFATPTTDLPDWSKAKVGDAYARSENGPTGIRRDHALMTLRRPDALNHLRHDAATFALATRKIVVPRPYTMLVEATDRGVPGGTLLSGAWRLYDAPENARPVELFAAHVSTYGLDVTFGELVTAQFVARLTVPNFQGEPSQLFQFPKTVEGDAVDVSGMFMQDGLAGDLHLSWGYALNRSAYERAVLARLR